MWTWLASGLLAVFVLSGCQAGPTVPTSTASQSLGTTRSAGASAPSVNDSPTGATGSDEVSNNVNDMTIEQLRAEFPLAAFGEENVNDDWGVYFNPEQLDFDQLEVFQPNSSILKGIRFYLPEGYSYDEETGRVVPDGIDAGSKVMGLSINRNHGGGCAWADDSTYDHCKQHIIDHFHNAQGVLKCSYVKMAPITMEGVRRSEVVVAADCNPNDIGYNEVYVVFEADDGMTGTFDISNLNYDNGWYKTGNVPGDLVAILKKMNISYIEIGT